MGSFVLVKLLVHVVAVCSKTSSSLSILSPRHHHTLLISSCGATKDGSRSDDISLDNSTATTSRKGYRFGDISRSILQGATQQVNQLTGNDEYEFGDLSRHLDQKAKERINRITGQERYEFGDLTRWVDSEIKASVHSCTNRTTYSVGDLSAEIVRRIRTGKYDIEDVLLSLRLLVSAGVSLTPLASFLPVRVLLSIVNFNLANDVGGRVMEEIVAKLEERLTVAINGSVAAKLPEFAKNEVMRQLKEFTGKQSFKDYKVGDMTRRAMEVVDKKPHTPSKETLKAALSFTEQSAKSLGEWDRRFLSSKQKKRYY